MKTLKLPYSGLEATQDDNPIAFPTLEITENGTYNVRGYQYAYVNVEGEGSGLFKIANVSISNGADTVCSAKGPFYDSETGIIWYAYSFIAGAEGTFNVVIPNEGGAIIVFLDESNHEMPTNRFEIEGDISVSEDEDNGFYVFGDCSIIRSGII